MVSVSSDCSHWPGCPLRCPAGTGACLTGISTGIALSFRFPHCLPGPAQGRPLPRPLPQPPPGSPAATPRVVRRYCGAAAGGSPPGCEPARGCAQRRRRPCGDRAQKRACGPAPTASHRASPWPGAAQRGSLGDDAGNRGAHTPDTGAPLVMRWVHERAGPRKRPLPTAGDVTSDGTDRPTGCAGAPACRAGPHRAPCGGLLRPGQDDPGDVVDLGAGHPDAAQRPHLLPRPGLRAHRPDPLPPGGRRHPALQQPHGAPGPHVGRHQPPGPGGGRRGRPGHGNRAGRLRRGPRPH